MFYLLFRSAIEIEYFHLFQHSPKLFIDKKHRPWNSYQNVTEWNFTTSGKGSCFFFRWEFKIWLNSCWRLINVWQEGLDIYERLIVPPPPFLVQHFFKGYYYTTTKGCCFGSLSQSPGSIRCFPKDQTTFISLSLFPVTYTCSSRKENCSSLSSRHKSINDASLDNMPSESCHLWGATYISIWYLPSFELNIKQKKNACQQI